MATNMKNICLRPEFSFKLADVLEVLSASIAVIIEAASISETSVRLYEPTRCNVPEVSHLYATLFSRFHVTCDRASLKKQGTTASELTNRHQSSHCA